MDGYISGSDLDRKIFGDYFQSMVNQIKNFGYADNVRQDIARFAAVKGYVTTPDLLNTERFYVSVPFHHSQEDLEKRARVDFCEKYVRDMRRAKREKQWWRFWSAE